MNRKPVIGITPYIEKTPERKLYVPEGYQKAIERTGGELKVLDYRNAPLYTLYDMVKEIDGLLLAGGPDIEPREYGQEREPECGESVPERDALEINIIPLTMAEEIPILGICRGFQMLNIAFGGTLIQDIPSYYGTQHQNQDVFAHEVRLYPNTRLREIMRTERMRVNSHHHQCVGKLAPFLVLSAASDENIIEGFESLDDHPFVMGLQWHPEISLDADEYSIRPFIAFMDAVRARMATRRNA